MMSKTALPLATRSSIKLLPLGTSVEFHHRAGVARYRKLHKETEERGWVIVDGLYPQEVVYRDVQLPYVTVSVKVDEHYFSDRRKHHFFRWPQAKSSGLNPGSAYNKTVLVWPEDGFGTIMGIIRRSIGVSSSGYRSRGMWGDDFEPGYHITDMYVDLYVVKQFYEGTDYTLCPLWAVREVSDTESEPGVNWEQASKRLYSQLADLVDEIDFLISENRIAEEPANLALAKRRLIEYGVWKESNA